MTRMEDDVRAKLSRLELGDEEVEVIVEEIAEHLRLAEEELCAIGMSDVEARANVLSSAGNWKRLSRKIKRIKENGMKDRLRRLWLPALGTGVFATIAESMILKHVARPQVSFFQESYFVYSWQWLLVLIVTGALGAYWSRAMGGSVRERVLAALAPSVGSGIFMVGMLPLGLIIETVANRGVPYAVRNPMAVVSMFAWMVVLPAVPSMIGAAWFLREDENAQSRPRASALG